MQRTFIALFLGLSFWLSAQPIALAEDGRGALVGDWQGVLVAGPQELRVVVHIKQVGGDFAVTLDSIDQGALALVALDFECDGKQMSFRLRDVLASYSGTLTGADRIEGFWNQGGGSLPLDLTRGGATIELKRPQEPKGPFPYQVLEVSWSYDPNGKLPDSLVKKPNADQTHVVTFGGTLTLPEGSKRAPAVILISGSGPQDRDEALFGHRPFWVLADYLSRRGIAVLRYDDRGVGESSGDFEACTSEDFAADVTSAFFFLKKHARIDGDRIALVGHSEGGLIAPMVAAEHPIAAAVLLAGPGVDGREILELQQRLILEKSGADPEALARASSQQQGLFDAVLGEDSDRGLESYLKKVYAELTEEEKGGLDYATFVSNTRSQVDSPWMRFFLRYDPQVSLRKMRCPVLAVNGAKDLQVDAGQNLPAIAQALEAGGVDDYALVKLPQLNHLFQHCETGILTEYGKIEETLAPELLELVGNWLRLKLEVSE